MDTNKVWLSGKAETAPVLSRIGETKTPSAVFRLKVDEVFRDRNNKKCTVPNFFTIEGLGRNADVLMKKIKPGKRYFIDGYLRKSLEDEVRVRCYSVYNEESDKNRYYEEGIRTAIELLDKTKDLSVLSQLLEEIIKKE